MKSPILCCLDSRATDNGSLYGRFLLGPFPIDLSLTVATTLRRGLLHSQPSFGIVSAEIEGAVHEYASLSGVQESVLELLLNLGEVVLTTTNRNLLERSFRNTGLLGSGIYIASLSFSGPGLIKAKDINWPEGVYCVNPDLHIATLSNNETLAMRIKIAAAFEDQTTSLFAKQLLCFCSANSKASKESLLSNKRQTPSARSATLGNLATKQAKEATAVVKDATAVTRPNEDTLSPGKESKDFLSNQQQKKQETEQQKTDFDKSSVTIFTSFEKPNPTLPSTMAKTSGDSQTNKIQENFNMKTLRNDLSSPTLFTIEHKLRSKTLMPQRPSFGKKQNTNNSIYQSGDRTFLQLLALLTLPTKQSKQNKHSKEKQEANCLKDLSLKSVREFSNIDSFVKTGHTQPRGVELAVSPCSYPVQKVNFVIERDDQWEGYRHRIILEVWTNGSISPRQAIFDTVAWTIKLLYNFRDPTRFRGRSMQF